MHFDKKLTPEQAIQKLRQYCSYQERAHTEVKEKLAEYGIYYEDAEGIISTLIQENFLNEERFARQYTGGKFRMKQWGRKKIKYQLKLKGVSEYCIKKGMQEIDEDDYLKTLNTLAIKKWDTLPGNNKRLKVKKTYDYLSGKGYETELILAELKKLK